MHRSPILTCVFAGLLFSLAGASTQVKMTGYNRSTTEPMRVVTFYVSDPDTPFLDPIQ